MSKEIESVQPTPQTEMDALLLGRTKELAAVVEGDGRNWRGIGIAFLVILVICGIIAVAVFLLSPEIITLKKHTKKDEIDLNDYINGAFYPRLFNGSWLTNDQLIYKDEDDNLVTWNINQNTSTRETFVPASFFHIHNVQDFTLSADHQYLLIKQDIQKIFRHTYTAKFKIYKIKDDELIPLSPSPKLPDARLQYARWGPKKDDLVFVYNNNLYYQPSVNAPSVQLTHDGNESVIYNGIPDWLYEEEILSDSNAIYWSPGGERVVYIQFNDSQVDTIGLTFYNDFLPKIYGLRYPRVARRNPGVKLTLIEVDSSLYLKMQVRPPLLIRNYRDYYVTDVTWINASHLSVTWSLRSQDISLVSLCSDSTGWDCIRMTSFNTLRKGWLELKSPVFDDTGRNGYIIAPSLQDEQHGSYHHICQFYISVNTEDNFITRGLFDVTSIIKYNRDFLYYQATLPGKPGERHLFKVNVYTQYVTCLTCDLKGYQGSNLESVKDSNSNTNDCLYSRAFFNEDASAYILSCLGPGIPRTELRITKSNSLVTTLQPNDALREKADELLLPKVKLLQVPIEGGYNASVKLLLPPGLREDEITKYPLVINVYGGPGTQQVTSRFDIGWGHYLASRRRIIYGMIDGRGSGNNGVKLLYEVYKRLGTVEIDDQIAVTRYLVNNLPYIDAKRVGIWGWSYGGYATTMALASEPTSPGFSEPVFSCGIAVAPVTSWYYYDSTYTERYMGLPTKEDNIIGYTKSDLISKIGNLKGKNYLLVHGTADDNVHVQQSMLLMRALQRNSIMFQSMIYPDQNHELPQVHRHLYRTIESFLCECFDLGTVYEEVGLRRRRIIKKEYS
ncbi:dipeptidyl peptidase 4-like isoform X2 [Panonychus citri]|uniref:dipeptidyl peptidase 4-like isoform X2 n=1 Tax=Panonychus citri TaxID=50023 RepID=UPI00230817B5|nr:dipeptidyl peptidase 4-like isoform X2 [Panonychus citri]